MDPELPGRPAFARFLGALLARLLGRDAGANLDQGLNLFIVIRIRYIKKYRVLGIVLQIIYA